MWDDPDHVAEYLERVPKLAQRRAGEGVLPEVLPRAPQRVLDLGCGDGMLSALVLESFPTVEHLVAVDRSPPMLARAIARFDGEPRVHVTELDLDAPLPGIGPFDAVVSGFAIHHVPDARKRTLFCEIGSLLRVGGVFANLDVVASATDDLHSRFLANIGRTEDDPEDQLVGVEEQLSWMRSAGLSNVDCLWRWRGFALLVGEAS